tara:strand:+ start:19322 stop:23740 length:4419 start_codon:yes stop_codon:yes gene_type:complete
MANVIKHKRGTSKPSASDLSVGEIAIDTSLGKLYTESDSGYVWAAGELTGDFSSSTITYTVTVESKTSAHRYNGTGSGSGYKINGVFAPFLSFTPGNTYRFDQSDSSNSNHPLKFYLEAAKFNQHTTGVTFNGTPGSAGAYTEITISDTTPLVLHYQCAYHAHMGNAVITNSNVAGSAINFTAGNASNLSSGTVPTARLGSGSASASTFLRGDGSWGVPTDTNTTYSVGDGGLTQNNFTNDLKSKLDGIAENADANVNADWNSSSGDSQILNKPTIPTNNNQLTNGAGYITATLTDEEVQDVVGAMFSSNTESGITATYQDSDGTIDLSVASQTDNNFTTALKNKLDGIESAATADQTASEILTLLLTVDGASSGLNADLLDGQEGSYYSDYSNLSNKPTIPTNNNQLTNGAGYTTDTRLTTEEVQDIVGAMVSSNSEVNIAVTYDDTNGKLDFNSQNTTYSVGDGGLTQNNFTDALKNKLDGIESGASGDQTAAEIRTLLDAASDSNILTDALLNKLNGIAAAANNYSIANDLLDEDNMSSNSAVKVPSQQSVKAYVDANSSDTTYSAGNGLTLSGTTFSVSAVALTTVQTAGSQSAQLALTTQEGDVVVRTDENKTYVRNSGSAGTMADFTLLATPTDSVLSVNGQTGAITSSHIRTAVGDASDSNIFTDALKSKLDGIASGATNVTNTNQLTNGAGFITAVRSVESVQDIVGGMFSGNTESGITATYQDADGTIDLSVASQTDNNFTTALKNKLDGIASGATNVTNNNQLTNGAGYVTQNTQLSTEQVQDIVGAMVSSNSESNISVTYDDSNGKLNFAATDTNTTYSVGDGGLTQKNFTTTLKSKLDGIAAGATNVTNNNQLTNGAGYVTQNTQLSNEQVQDIVGAMFSGNSETNITATYQDSDGTIDLAATNTTYSVGDGGLTQKNFTTTLKNKLDGIAAGATNTAAPYYTSAISVGDGGLTQKNFTTTLKDKLDGIAAGATNVTNNNQLTNGAGYITSYVNTQLSNEQVQDIVGAMVSGNSESNISVTYNDSTGKLNFAATDTNTTYSVGDGGLTQKNFTTTLKNKLDGIAAGANNITNNNQLTNGAGYVTSDTNTTYDFSVPSGTTKLRLDPSSGSNDDVEIAGGANVTVTRNNGNKLTISATDTNTTYSVGDGGLTQKNFTTTLKNKLDGIAAGANNITNNNQLTNGAGYVTTNTTYSVGDGGLTQKNFTTTLKNKLDGIASGATNVTNNNQLTNGAGYVTSSHSHSYASSSHTHSYASTSHTHSYASTSHSHTISYNDLTNKPTIPTNNNQLTNGAGYVTTDTTYSVGDGGLTQKNFTTTLKNKLDGIASGANNITNNNQISNGAGYTTYSSNQATNTSSSVTFGSVTSSGNVTAYSDVKLKTDIHTIDNALGIVGKLRGVNYKWLNNGQSDVGVIAQEVEAVVPEVVKETDDGIKTVDYGRLVCVLIESVKELTAKVKELEAK